MERRGRTGLGGRLRTAGGGRLDDGSSQEVMLDEVVVVVVVVVVVARRQPARLGAGRANDNAPKARELTEN